VRAFWGCLAVFIPQFIPQKIPDLIGSDWMTLERSCGYQIVKKRIFVSAWSFLDLD
jgi:hypothetical protein